MNLPLISNPNEPSIAFDSLPLHWQMSRCEKFAFDALVRHAQADVAVEIGTYKGGSLQILAKHCGKVHSLDISEAPKRALESSFNNVEFHIGDSPTLVPEVLARINSSSEKLGFVLIDGDHSTEGVRNDINAVLKHRPERPVYVVFHDSFHPACRSGILSASWSDCPYVHYLEVDFVPGIFHKEAFDTAPARSMFGGLSLAVMLPEERKGELRINQSQEGLFDAVYLQSCYNSQRPSVARRIARKMRKFLRSH